MEDPSRWAHYADTIDATGSGELVAMLLAMSRDESRTADDASSLWLEAARLVGLRGGLVAASELDGLSETRERALLLCRGVMHVLRFFEPDGPMDVPAPPCPPWCETPGSWTGWDVIRRRCHRSHSMGWSDFQPSSGTVDVAVCADEWAGEGCGLPYVHLDAVSAHLTADEAETLAELLQTAAMRLRQGLPAIPAQPSGSNA